MKRAYDFIVCGAGPGAAAWVRSTLRTSPGARILLLERGPYCKTDILTETNPLKVLIDSRRVVKEYQHSVVQGAVLGGGTAVNNYAWITPSQQDVSNGFGAVHADAMAAHLPDYEGFIDSIAARSPPHMLHKLLTMDLNDGTSLVNNATLSVRDSNRNAVFIGSPTLDSLGQRRSAFTGVIEPLWRENFDNLDILTDADVSKVILEQQQAGGEPVAVGVELKSGEVYRGQKVVVASGCIETPALLMRSGVGPEKHLRERGVGVSVANEHVGQHLRDKVSQRLCGCSTLLHVQCTPTNRTDSPKVPNLLT
jgi:choline dehydrogenase